MNRPLAISAIVAALICTLLLAYGGDRASFDGHWKLVREKSASIDPWSELLLDIHTEGGRITIVKRYSAGNRLDRRVDSLTVGTEGREETAPALQGRWLGQVSMGIYYGARSERHVVARMREPGTELQVEIHETLQTAQGVADVDGKETFTLLPDGSTIQWSESRSTRKTGPPLTYTFARVEQ